MIKFLMVAAILSTACLSAQSQLLVDSAATAGSEKTLGAAANVFSDLVKAIKPAAFDNAASGKKTILSTAGSINSASTLGKATAMLVSDLRASAFAPTFQKSDLLKKAQRITTFQSARFVLKDLEKNLKRGYMSDIWALQRSVWQSNLDALH